MPMTDDAVRRPSLDQVRLGGLIGRDWQIEILPETPSTNAVAADRARAGAPEGLVVTTEHQTAGRGRLDRTWQMPPRAALAVSVVLRPAADVPVTRWPWLPLMTGVAVAGALDEYAAGLKWPNDVLIPSTGSGRRSYRKVCGILVERIETADGPAAIVGFGLNTSLAREELPVTTATSLELESGHIVDRTALLADLLLGLGAAYDDWRLRPADLRQAYRDLSVTLGEPVRAELPGGETFEGTATAIDDDGRLVVDTPSGERIVGAGDVIHARLATP